MLVWVRVAPSECLWCAFYLHPDFIILRRGPSLPSISPHAPVRVPVRACACLRQRVRARVPVRARSRLCPEVRACPAVRALACPVVHLVRVRARRRVRVRACLLRVPASRALALLASRVRPVLTLTALAGLTVPGCGGRRSAAGLSSGLHPRRSRLSSACSAVSFLYLVQSYCGGSISRVLAVPLEALLGL